MKRKTLFFFWIELFLYVSAGAEGFHTEKMNYGDLCHWVDVFDLAILYD